MATANPLEQTNPTPIASTSNPTRTPARTPNPTTMNINTIRFGNIDPSDVTQSLNDLVNLEDNYEQIRMSEERIEHQRRLDDSLTREIQDATLTLANIREILEATPRSARLAFDIAREQNTNRSPIEQVTNTVDQNAELIDSNNDRNPNLINTTREQTRFTNPNAHSTQAQNNVTHNLFDTPQLICLKLKDAQNSIPTFDGRNPDDLENFINCCQYSFKYIDPNFRHMLLHSIINLKLKGRARMDIGDKIFKTFEELKLFLEKNYGEKIAESIINKEFLKCKQAQGENAREFGNRVRGLIKKLNKSMLSDVNNPQVRHFIEEMNNKKGLKTFVNGLHSNLRIIIDARNYTNLDDAIDNAYLKEQEYTEEPERTKNLVEYCTFCRRVGHDYKDCRSKDRNYDRQWSSGNNLNRHRPQNCDQSKYYGKNNFRRNGYQNSQGTQNCQPNNNQSSQNDRRNYKGNNRQNSQGNQHFQSNNYESYPENFNQSHSNSQGNFGGGSQNSQRNKNFYSNNQQLNFAHIQSQGMPCQPAPLTQPQPQNNPQQLSERAVEFYPAEIPTNTTTQETPAFENDSINTAISGNGRGPC